MFQSRLNAVKLFMLILASLSLLGCSMALVSQRTSSAPAVKLTSARVTWANNPSLSYRITSRYQITASNRIHANEAVGRLLFQFQKSAVQNIRQRLASNNINEGNDAILELTPVTASIVMGGPIALTVKASLKKAHHSEELWSVEIKAIGQSFLVEDPKMPEKMLEDFVSSVIFELKNADWLI